MDPAIGALRAIRNKARRGRVAKDDEDKGYGDGAVVTVEVTPSSTGPHPEPVDTTTGPHPEPVDTGADDDEEEELIGY